jgi:hypothetical protein
MEDGRSLRYEDGRNYKRKMKILSGRLKKGK